MISTFIYPREDFQEILSRAFGIKLTVCSDLRWVIIGPCAISSQNKITPFISEDLFPEFRSRECILLIPACCGPYRRSDVELFKTFSPQATWISLGERFDGLDIVNSLDSWICRERVQTLGRILIKKGLVIASDLA